MSVLLGLVVGASTNRNKSPRMSFLHLSIPFNDFMEKHIEFFAHLVVILELPELFFYVVYTYVLLPGF